MFFLGHSLIIINWMKFLTTIKRFILHKNPIHNIRDRGFQRLEQKNQVLHSLWNRGSCGVYFYAGSGNKW